jgi:type IV pilus assembly protein PilY1
MKTTLKILHSGKGGLGMKRCAWIVMLLIFGNCSGAWADDTEIYGVVNAPTIEPNVLIIFDTSGSMGTQDVPGEPYNSATTYSGSYSRNTVYQRQWNNSLNGYEWILFTNDVNNLSCDTIKSALLTVGYATGKVRSNLTCGGSTTRRLRLGNFANYDASGIGEDRTRIEVAKNVLSDLINTTNGVRFGMMVFNNNQGGRVVAPCGTDKSTLLSQIANATAEGWTPLAETLAEAGLYFAGKPSWFNSGVSYTSPMQERCQKNYIIIMTDGEPTQDRDHRLYDTSYINGDIIGDYDGDHNGGSEFDSYPSNGSDYLDDVAKYLYENDCNPSMGDGTSFDKQNITTFTIGFKTQQQLLQSTATNGGGEYFTAETYSSLSEAFSQIMSSIVEKNAVFVAPVVPISRMNRVYAGDKIYLGFFKPQNSGRWLGNIKRYALENNGTLKDAKADDATTPDGMIKDNSLSWWTSLGNDGPAVEKGGAAEALELQIASGATRNVYTYTGTQALLTDASNAFIPANTAIANAELNVADDASRQSLFNTVRTGEFGDIIHSEPAVVYYPDPDGNPGTNDAKTIIYVGANDGLLHAIDDDTGRELWSFVPRDQLGRLHRLNDADHDYFVDGSPVVYNGTSQKVLIIGGRRGGDSYTALDITNYNAPRYLYSIGPNILDPDPTNIPDSDTYERLGQSWSRPEKVTIATSSTVTTTGCDVNISVNTADVFLLAGGYDENQDQATPNATDSFGRAVFAVNLTTGQLVNNIKVSATTHPSLGITHSVVDLAGIDHDGDGIVSRIYYGDLGGSVFALKDDQNVSYSLCGKTITRNVVDGTWSAQKLFNASADGVQRKIQYAPDAVGESFGEYIFFGTGDRERPGNTSVVNRFYAVKNEWAASGVLTEADLVDVTNDLIQLGTADEQQQVKTALALGKGWYIRLENAGEKIVSSPRVFGGAIYFSTYTPSGTTGSDPADRCAASTVRGVGRLYALNYKNGGSVHDFSSPPETSRAGGSVTLGKNDRSFSIGTAIPSAPVIAILGGGARLFVGVEGGIASLPTVVTQDMVRYYWNRNF